MAAAFPPPTSPPLYVARPGPRRPPLPPLEGRARTLVRVELLVMLFVLAVPSLVVGLQGLGTSQEVDTDLTYLEIAGMVLAGLGPVALSVFLLWRDGVLSRSPFQRRSPGFVIGWGALTFVCVVGAAIVGGILVQLVKSLLGSEAGGNVASTDFTLRYLVVALGLSLAAGVGEEAVWRGYAIARMEQAGFPRAAYLVPSGIWVLLHLYGGPYTVLAISFIGAPFVWMAWWKHSVWPLMLAHVAWDVLAFLAATIDTDSAIAHLVLR